MSAVKFFNTMTQVIEKTASQDMFMLPTNPVVPTEREGMLDFQPNRFSSKRLRQLGSQIVKQLKHDQFIGSKLMPVFLGGFTGLTPNLTSYITNTPKILSAVVGAGAGAGLGAAYDAASGVYRAQDRLSDWLSSRASRAKAYLRYRKSREENPNSPIVGTPNLNTFYDPQGRIDRNAIQPYNYGGNKIYYFNRAEDYLDKDLDTPRAKSRYPKSNKSRLINLFGS